MTKKKSKVKSDGLDRLQISFVEMSSSKIKVKKTVDIATIKNFATKAKTGTKAIAFLGIDPGLTPLTVVVVKRTKKSRKIYGFSFLSRPATDVKTNDWQDRFYRISLLTAALKSVLETVSSAYVAIEGYAYGKGNKGAVLTLAEVKQAILIAVNETVGFSKTLILPPPTWKACLCPESKDRSKFGIQQCLLAKEPYLESGFKSDHNLYDAYAMAAVYEGVKLGELTSRSALSLIERENIELEILR